jgi:hypothetical protein
MRPSAAAQAAPLSRARPTAHNLSPAQEVLPLEHSLSWLAAGSPFTPARAPAIAISDKVAAARMRLRHPRHALSSLHSRPLLMFTLRHR